MMPAKNPFPLCVNFDHFVAALKKLYNNRCQLLARQSTRLDQLATARDATGLRVTKTSLNAEYNEKKAEFLAVLRCCALPLDHFTQFDTLPLDRQEVLDDQLCTSFTAVGLPEEKFVKSAAVDQVLLGENRKHWHRFQTEMDIHRMIDLGFSSASTPMSTPAPSHSHPPTPIPPPCQPSTSAHSCDSRPMSEEMSIIEPISVERSRVQPLTIEHKTYAVDETKRKYVRQRQPRKQTHVPTAVPQAQQQQQPQQQQHPQTTMSEWCTNPDNLNRLAIHRIKPPIQLHGGYVRCVSCSFVCWAVGDYIAHWQHMHDRTMFRCTLGQPSCTIPAALATSIFMEVHYATMHGIPVAEQRRVGLLTASVLKLPPHQAQQQPQLSIVAPTTTHQQMQQQQQQQAVVNQQHMEQQLQYQRQQQAMQQQQQHYQQVQQQRLLGMAAVQVQQPQVQQRQQPVQPESQVSSLSSSCLSMANYFINCIREQSIDAQLRVILEALVGDLGRATTLEDDRLMRQAMTDAQNIMKHQRNNSFSSDSIGGAMSQSGGSANQSLQPPALTKQQQEGVSHPPPPVLTEVASQSESEEHKDSVGPEVTPHRPIERLANFVAKRTYGSEVSSAGLLEVMQDTILMVNDAMREEGEEESASTSTPATCKSVTESGSHKRSSTTVVESFGPVKSPCMTTVGSPMPVDDDLLATGLIDAGEGGERKPCFHRCIDIDSDNDAISITKTAEPISPTISNRGENSPSGGGEGETFEEVVVEGAKLVEAGEFGSALDTFQMFIKSQRFHDDNKMITMRRMMMVTQCLQQLRTTETVQHPLPPLVQLRLLSYCDHVLGKLVHQFDQWQGVHRAVLQQLIKTAFLFDYWTECLAIIRKMSALHSSEIDEDSMTSMRTLSKICLTSSILQMDNPPSLLITCESNICSDTLQYIEEEADRMGCPLCLATFSEEFGMKKCTMCTKRFTLHL